MAVAITPAAHGENYDFFEAKIRPILVENCYSCHSDQAKKLKADLHLDTKQGVLNGGKDGVVLLPGDPEHSKLIEAIRWTNSQLKMPPKRPLTAAQVADLEAWVKMGAPDPRIGPIKPASAGIDFAAARRQWAFHSPQEPAIPEVKRPAWCKSPVDRFILAKLEDKGLNPAPMADKRALIRRAYFDLIGLPPSPEEVDAFVNDPTPNAFAKVVDHLLANPQYGVRWARHWLDVVRYTDSFDARAITSTGDCTEAWRYRDWVVNAFNRDLPYDQFIVQQVAGDLLPAKDEAARNDALIATGMYVIGNWPGGDADRKKMLTDIVDDQIDVTGRAFLGLTLACARCHDHKFDPIPTADYYGLAGIFFSSHFMPAPGSSTAGGPILRFPIAPASEIEKRKLYDDRVAALTTRIARFNDEAMAARAREMLPSIDRYLNATWEYLRRKDAGGLSIQAVAAEQKLDEALLTRWVEYADRYLSHNASRVLLTTPHHNVGGIAGLDSWTGPINPQPVLTANATDRAISLTTIVLPPKSVSVHPGRNSGVAVEWRSPIAGSIAVRGRVIDADSICGNGIDWAIDHIAGDHPQRLASGAFANGGRQEFAAGNGGEMLERIEVKKGDLLQLAVYPKGDYTCDTTVVEFDIIERDGAKRVWNLTRDILPDALAGGKGNPRADSFGNADVWEFCEIPDETTGGALPAESALARWAGAVAGKNTAQVAAASIAVRDAMLALDVRADALRHDGKDLATLSGPDAGVYRELISAKGPLALAAAKNGKSLPSPAAAEIAQLKQELATLQKNAPLPLPACHGMAEGGVPEGMYAGIADTRIHVRGRYDRQTELVPRHFPRLLAGDEQPTISQGSGRLPLARFLASPSNPLTARVMVNRIWQHHFDDGIVRTPNNYGKLGRPPTHPELLDWLALEFIRQGWSIKAMQREIMLSAAYQQSAIPDPQTFKADPDDLLFGWVKRRRLEAESIRDSLLAQSGTVDETLAGPSTRDLNSHRRTLFLMTVRSERSDYRTLFDAADATAIVDQRIDSTVAPQALFLLNNPFVLDQARLIAARALKEGPADDRGKIVRLYRRLYSRAPGDTEIRVGIDLVLESQLSRGGAKPLTHEEAWEAYCQVLVCANEFVFVD